MNTTLFIVLLVVLVIAVAVITAYLLRGGNVEDAETYVDYTSPDFSAKAGFKITNYPNDEILSPQTYRLVNGTTGEIIYKATPADMISLRVAPSGKLIIPASYKDANYENVAEYPIDGVTVTHSQSAGQQAMLQWSKNGFDYALLSPSPEMNLMGGSIDDFVNNTDAVKT